MNPGTRLVPGPSLPFHLAGEGTATGLGRLCFLGISNNSFFRVCLQAILSKADYDVLLEKPHQTSYLLNLSRDLQRTENYIVFSYVLLSVFGKTRESETKTWKISMPRESGRNPPATRKSIRSVANQFFSQQFVEYPCRSTKWRWNKRHLWQL